MSCISEGFQPLRSGLFYLSAKEPRFSPTPTSSEAAAPGTILHFGPYTTPAYRVGDVVDCAIRGSVTIVGVSQGRIAWPVGKTSGASVAAPVVFEDLERAIHLESAAAVRYWWGVSRQTVSAWRAAGGVAYNYGDQELRSALSKVNWSKIAPKLRRSNECPERAAKISIKHTGRKRPKYVVEKIRERNLGRKHTPEARKNMSDAQRRRGTRPPWLNSAWTAEEDAVLRSCTVEEAVRRLNRSATAIACRRSRLGLSKKRAATSPAKDCA